MITPRYFIKSNPTTTFFKIYLFNDVMESLDYLMYLGNDTSSVSVKEKVGCRVLGINEFEMLFLFGLSWQGKFVSLLIGYSLISLDDSWVISIKISHDVSQLPIGFLLFEIFIEW